MWKKTLWGKTHAKPSRFFMHSLVQIHTMSRIFGIGKKKVLQKLINQDQVIGKCAQAFYSQKLTQESIASYGNMAMLNVFSSNKTDTLSPLRYSLLCTKISKAKSFVAVERLPPTASACKFPSLQVSFQNMLWMRLNNQINPCDWGLEDSGR